MRMVPHKDAETRTDAAETQRREMDMMREQFRKELAEKRTRPHEALTGMLRAAQVV